MTSPAQILDRLAPCVLAWALPVVAAASDGSLPRTPMLPLEEECMVRVDRLVDPVVHLPYTIPFADTCLGADELEDSRTHQMVAFCRSPGPAFILPHWIDEEDVMRAGAAGQLPEPPPDAEDILETSEVWEGCWTRVIPDAERRPIHCQAALPGMDWDTSSISAGVYVVGGYTFDPPLNMWVPRRGVYKVFDGDGAALPAAGLAPHPTSVGNETAFPLRVCADAAVGATARVQWAPVGTEDWATLVELDPAPSGAATVDVMLPLGEGDAPQEVTLRITVEDPAGERYTYHSPDAVLVLPGASEPSGSSVVTNDECQDDPDALEPQDCGEQGPAPGSICGCRSEGRLPLGVGLLGLWLGGARIGRRQ